MALSVTSNASSACIYPEYKQQHAKVTALKEEDAYPAQPQDAYGWEKLISERLCMHYREDYGIETRVVRFQGLEPTYACIEEQVRMKLSKTSIVESVFEANGMTPAHETMY
jgi:hypothetical protein